MRVITVLIVGTLALSGCSSGGPTRSRAGATPAIPGASALVAPAAPSSVLSVVASFYPLYEFARRIGGEHARVRNLVPVGAEPHDYEPTARNLAALHATRLLVYNGAGLEPWIDKLLAGLPGTVERINTTAGLPLVKAHHEDERTGGEQRTPEQNAGFDPHVWLDPVLAGRQVDAILTGFVKVDPRRKATYQVNAASLKADLQALHAKYTDTLRPCRQKSFITSHAAFGYLARRYGLTMVSISGPSPEADPSPARLKEIIKLARRYGIRVIYTEALLSPRVAQTIAREVGAQIRALNPIEGLTPAEQSQGASYVTVMHENLRNLTEGLDCR